MPDSMVIRATASRGCAAARSGSALRASLALLALIIANSFALSCGIAARPKELPAAVGPLLVATQSAPSEAERYCAWYGSERDAVLYFGESPFWWAMRHAGGDPAADLAVPGPQWVGRFDLAAGRMLAPLDVGDPSARAGVWDVLAHPNGRVYFTTFFEEAGWVDPGTGAVVRLGPESVGWNELATGPEAGVLVSRYGDPAGGAGSVVWLDADGGVRRELRLAGPAGYSVAPKTVAWDPRRREAWVTSDVLPAPGSPLPERHDAWVLSLDPAAPADGAEAPAPAAVRRWGGGPGDPELQFVRFAADGAGRLVVAHGSRLELVLLPAGGGLDALARAPHVLLDDRFPAGLDFAQDVQPAPGGGAVVTRWSGRIHVVRADGEVRSLSLPMLEEGGLYYTGVIRDGRLCATFCADVTVVCRAAPR